MAELTDKSADQVAVAETGWAELASIDAAPNEAARNDVAYEAHSALDNAGMVDFGDGGREILDPAAHQAHHPEPDLEPDLDDMMDL